MNYKNKEKQQLMQAHTEAQKKYQKNTKNMLTTRTTLRKTSFHDVAIRSECVPFV